MWRSLISHTKLTTISGYMLIMGMIIITITFINMKGLDHVTSNNNLIFSPAYSVQTDWRYPKQRMIIHKTRKITIYFIPTSSYFLKQQNSVNLTSDKTTLIMMAYTNHPGLIQLIEKYAKYTSSIYEIVLIWNNPEIDFKHNQIFDDIKFMQILDIDIIIYPQSQNSLANRWMITKYHTFKTQSAMFIDDDIYASNERISCLLNVWNQHKNNIVSSGGYRTLQRASDDDNYVNLNKNNVNIRYEFDYKEKIITIDGLNTTIFNMLLPGWGMTIKIEYIFKLSQVLQQFHLLQIIDNQMGHCDDIAMALSFSYIFGKNKPYFLGIDNFRLETNDNKRKAAGQLPIDLHDYDTRKLQRHECLNLFLDNFEKYGLRHIPIYDHQIGINTISCDEMSMKPDNDMLYCPYSACWERSDEGK